MKTRIVKKKLMKNVVTKLWYKQLVTTSIAYLNMFVLHDTTNNEFYRINMRLLMKMWVYEFNQLLIQYNKYNKNIGLNKLTQALMKTSIDEITNIDFRH